MQVVYDCADSIDKTKAKFEAGAGGVVPMDQFDAFCEQRGSYEGSAWFKSWGCEAAHPEHFLIDRDGNVRWHIYAWAGDASMVEEEGFVKQLVGAP